MSPEEAPTWRRKSPRSMTVSPAAFTSENASAPSFRVTGTVSPALMKTRSKARSCFRGRTVEASGSTTYSWTTSSPSREPVFFTLTVTSTSGTRPETVRPEYSKVV